MIIGLVHFDPTDVNALFGWLSVGSAVLRQALFCLVLWQYFKHHGAPLAPGCQDPSLQCMAFHGEASCRICKKGSCGLWLEAPIARWTSGLVCPQELQMGFGSCFNLYIIASAAS